MSIASIEQVTTPPPSTPATTQAAPEEHAVALPRRIIDSVLIGIGLIATVVFLVAGILLTWGSNFSSDYVYKELSSQNITFPSAEDLTAEGRTDLVEFAGQRLTTGDGAEAYASFINGHLQGIADGQTYADLGGPEAAAKAALKTAVADGAPQADVDTLQANLDTVSGQRNSLFKGETLRGLLLSAYAWATVGTIAGYAATGAFIAAALTAILVIMGLVHLIRTAKAQKPVAVAR